MQKDIVSVTDHIKEFNIEEDILGDYFSKELTVNTTIALVWHQEINEDFIKKLSLIHI